MARYWFVLLAIVLAAVTSTTAQDTTARLFHNFTVVPNITYLTASNYSPNLTSMSPARQSDRYQRSSTSTAAVGLPRQRNFAISKCCHISRWA